MNKSTLIGVMFEDLSNSSNGPNNPYTNLDDVFDYHNPFLIHNPSFWRKTIRRQPGRFLKR